MFGLFDWVQVGSINSIIVPLLLFSTAGRIVEKHLSQQPDSIEKE